MDLLINLANILYVIAYFTNNMLRLRLLTLIAAACLAMYFYYRPEPMLNVVAWNLFFLALNFAQVARLLLAPAPVKAALIKIERRSPERTSRR